MACAPLLGGLHPVLPIKPQHHLAPDICEQTMATQPKLAIKPARRIYGVTGAGKSAFRTPLSAA